MGKRPRIGSLLSKSDNSANLKTLDKLNKKFSAYYKRQLDLCERHGYNACNGPLMKEQKQEIEYILQQFKLENPKEGAKFIEDFEQLGQGRKFPYDSRNFKQKIQKALYLEHAKKLTPLIASYNASQSPADKQKVDDYVASLNDNELFAVLNSAIERFKDRPTDAKLEETNTLLGYFHKQIVKEEYKSSINSHNVKNNAAYEFNSRKTARADFNGGFYTVSRQDLAKHNPFSKAYQEFTQQRNKPLTAKDDYDLNNCPAWQACLQSDNFAKLEPHFKNSLVSLRIPPEILKDLNAVDIMDIMTPDEYAHRDKSRFISFQKLNYLCSKGILRTILDRIDTQELDKAISLVSIGHGKPKSKQGHHDYPLNTYGINGNNGSISVMVNYKTEEENNKNDIDCTDIHCFMHKADLVLRQNNKKLSPTEPDYFPVELDERYNGDIMFYMLDTRTAECRKNNKIMVLSGLREKDFTTVDLPAEKTKLAEQRVSQGVSR